MQEGHAAEVPSFVIYWNRPYQQYATKSTKDKSASIPEWQEMQRHIQYAMSSPIFSQEIHLAASTITRLFIWGNGSGLFLGIAGTHIYAWSWWTIKQVTEINCKGWKME